MEICKRDEVHFLEIGKDNDDVHFLTQSVPQNSPTQIVTIIKSLTAKEIFKKHPEVKKMLWSGEVWSDGYFVNTVSNTKYKYILVLSAIPFLPILLKEIVP